MFKNLIIVENSSGQSSQAHVFFGKEATLGIRVVLKQYIGAKKKGIMAEIKLFTLIELFRQEQTKSEQLKSHIGECMALKGLPIMLAYKVSRDYSEILMTHGGNNIETWMNMLKSREDRVKLAAKMLKQGISAIKVLHDLGYAHGDLKPENICARKTKNGKFKFSIIDFGICQRLPDINVV